MRLATVTPRADLLRGLVAYWKFEEGSGTRVDTYGAHNMTIVSGAPSSGTGIVGNCLSLAAASSQYLEMADDAALSFTGDFWWSVWVQLASKGSDRCVFSKGNSGSSPTPNPFEYVCRYQNSSDRFRFLISNNTTSITREFSNLGSPALNTWYNLQMWLDTTAGKLFAQAYTPNGPVQADSIACTILPWDSTFGLRFGRTVGVSTNYWDGLIDEAAVWNRKPTAVERNQVWRNGAARQYPFY
jgi:hypothetical protein